MLKILFIGDIFGTQGKNIVREVVPRLIREHHIDFVIAQGENVTDRKGLNRVDYNALQEAGVNVLTMGNHVWANPEVIELMGEDANIIRPYNASNQKGVGTKVFTFPDGTTLRVTSLMGITFNKLNYPWTQHYADNFFDAIDGILADETSKTTYHFVDFHAETTSEKNVLALYLDGKVDVLVGTHTHVQTNDERILPGGTAFITDVGMTGPHNCAIGANFAEVYRRMRFNEKTRFYESQNAPQFNAVLVTLTKNHAHQIEKIAINPK